jgi:hypothetical protein
MTDGETRQKWVDSGEWGALRGRGKEDLRSAILAAQDALKEEG